jgi:hypothetical protein
METYIRQIIKDRTSSIPFGELAKILPQTSWRLEFSTEAATMGDLPRDATVRLEFVDNQRMNYILQFTEQTFGLKRIVAKSTYTIQVRSTQKGRVLHCLRMSDSSTMLTIYNLFAGRAFRCRIGYVCL